MNHIPENATRVVSTPIHDPSLAAILVALDFPLVGPRFEVQTVDLNSPTSNQTVDRESWVFGISSPTHGDIDSILRQFSQPLPRKPSNLSALQLAKLALHNRRCLKLAAAQSLPLHQLSVGNFTRLSSWPFADSHLVEPDFESMLPRVSNSDLVALATACGHSILSTARYGGQLFFLLKQSPEALYPLAEIETKFRDRSWIQAHTDPLAVASASILSFKPLFEASQAGANMFNLKKNGRSALISKNATEADKIAVAQHLST